MSEPDPALRNLLNGEIHKLIDVTLYTLDDLKRQAEYVRDRFCAFTYANGPAANRPTHDWSRTFPQIHSKPGAGRFYIYWRHHKTTIRSKGGNKVRLSQQIPMPTGRLKYRDEAITSKAQPWEREELLRAEADFAAIRRKVKNLTDLHKLLADIQKSDTEPEAP